MAINKKNITPFSSFVAFDIETTGLDPFELLRTKESLGRVNQIRRGRMKEAVHYFGEMLRLGQPPNLPLSLGVQRSEEKKARVYFTKYAEEASKEKIALSSYSKETILPFIYSELPTTSESFRNISEKVLIDRVVEQFREIAAKKGKIIGQNIYRFDVPRLVEMAKRSGSPRTKKVLEELIRQKHFVDLSHEFLPFLSADIVRRKEARQEIPKMAAQSLEGFWEKKLGHSLLKMSDPHKTYNRFKNLYKTKILNESIQAALGEADIDQMFVRGYRLQDMYEGFRKHLGWEEIKDWHKVSTDVEVTTKLAEFLYSSSLEEKSQAFDLHNYVISVSKGIDEQNETIRKVAAEIKRPLDPREILETEGLMSSSEMEAWKQQKKNNEFVDIQRTVQEQGPYLRHRGELFDQMGEIFKEFEKQDRWETKLRTIGLEREAYDEIKANWTRRLASKSNFFRKASLLPILGGLGAAAIVAGGLWSALSDEEEWMGAALGAAYMSHIPEGNLVRFSAMEALGEAPKGSVLAKGYEFMRAAEISSVWEVSRPTMFARNKFSGLIHAKSSLARGLVGGVAGYALGMGTQLVVDMFSNSFSPTNARGNSIPGFQENGMGAIQRKYFTDMGSGWQGLKATLRSLREKTIERVSHPIRSTAGARKLLDVYEIRREIMKVRHSKLFSTPAPQVIPKGEYKPQLFDVASNKKSEAIPDLIQVPKTLKAIPIQEAPKAKPKSSEILKPIRMRLKNQIRKYRESKQNELTNDRIWRIACPSTRKSCKISNRTNYQGVY